MRRGGDEEEDRVGKKQHGMYLKNQRPKKFIGFLLRCNQFQETLWECP